MSLLDKNILDYQLSYLSFHHSIFDLNGNELGRFANSGYFGNKLLDSDKSVILNVKMTGWKKILFRGDRKIYDSSENLIGSIDTTVYTWPSLLLSLKDKYGDEVLYGTFHGEKNIPYNIYDNHKNVIAQITVIGEGTFRGWFLRVLEPSYDRALLLCFFGIVYVEQTVVHGWVPHD